MTTPSLRPGCAAFQVEELQAYDHCGDGEHRYLWIEKEDLTTDAAIGIIAKACKVKARAIGHAGRKDRHGITRQWLSVQFGQEPDPAIIAHACERFGDQARLVVLQQTRHRNKLKPGHLAGNRFILGLDGVDDADALQQLADTLAQNGILNRFGDQRFGHRGDNPQLARHLATGDWHGLCKLLVDPTGDWQPGQSVPDEPPPGCQRKAWQHLRRRPDDFTGAWRATGQPFAKLIRNAAQSDCFNAVLTARAADGHLRTGIAGDVLHKGSGAGFVAEAIDADISTRLTKGELVTTGPLPGRGDLQPTGAAASYEADILTAAGWDPAWFLDARGIACPGSRRALLTHFIETPWVETASAGSRISFALGPGSYATEVLSQLDITVPVQRGG